MTINLLEPVVPEQKVSSVWQRSSRFITCLFCGLRGRQVGDSPLCSNCLIDPVQTRTAIYLQMHGIEKQQEAVGAAWLAIATEHADRWAQIVASRNQPDYAAKCAAHRASGNIYGKLLDAHDAMLAAMQPLDLERARLDRALKVLGDV